VLATLSKENGALLPLLLAVVEFCAPQTQTRPRPARLFLALCLWLPSIALLGYLLRMVDFSPNPWPHRTFNQPERLWTEARLMWDYLRNLFLPRIEGSGLYQDGIVVSHGWLSPPSTLLAAVGLLALFFVGIFARKRSPLLGLALLFFLAGHLLESTVVGLEAVFRASQLFACRLFVFAHGARAGRAGAPYFAPPRGGPGRSHRGHAGLFDLPARHAVGPA